jgi:hypothetical protein
MKTGLTISVCLICSVGGMVDASFAHIAAANSHPRVIETARRVPLQNMPHANSRAKPVSPSGLLALSGTSAGAMDRSNRNPIALGRLAKPSNATPAVLAGAGINRKP